MKRSKKVPSAGASGLQRLHASLLRKNRQVLLTSAVLWLSAGIFFFAGAATPPVAPDAAAPLLSPQFFAGTQPAIRGVVATVVPQREGNVWTLAVRVTNRSRRSATFKLFLAAEPGFAAEHFLIPGTNYDGNPYGGNMPQGWEKDGEPWVFAYDRSSIPSCTITEDASRVFALFASDGDTSSFVSACSLEKKADGSFRHIIYWPETEAPLTYSGKLKFTERIDRWLTLAPGASFSVTAYACAGVPKWPAYGFASVFPVAWQRLNHRMPARRSVAEVMRLDKCYQDWCRRRDANGWWYSSIQDDEVFVAGYYKSGKSHDGYTVEDYDRHPEWNRWATDEVAASKNLAPGEWLEGPGRALGFAGQTMQMARLSIEYGIRNGSPSDVDFGLKSLRSWIRARQLPCGLFHGYKPKAHYREDASSVGWSISELARTAMLLRSRGMDASEFEEAAAKVVALVLRGIREDGALGSVWNGDDGHVESYGGDGGGYVLMGLARWWKLTRDERLRPVMDKAFEYYYKKDINSFRCSGGAMDCVSVDREGIHPFLSAAMLLHAETGEARYLEYARKAAWYFLSWLYIQNPVYGPETDFARFDIRPAGATIVGTEHPALDEYACVLIPEFLALSRVDGDPLWREVAALIWCYSTQGFADESHRIWHSLERPVGSKHEAIFPTRWSKYRIGEKQRGSINDHLTAWAGTYRLASLYELSVEDLIWLSETCRPR